MERQSLFISPRVLAHHQDPSKDTDTVKGLGWGLREDVGGDVAVSQKTIVSGHLAGAQQAFEHLCLSGSWPLLPAQCWTVFPGSLILLLPTLLSLMETGEI